MRLSVRCRRPPCQPDGRERETVSGLGAVADQLEQVAVGIQEVEALVVAPVDRGVVRDVALGEEALRTLVVVPRDLERVVTLPERGLDLLEVAWRALRREEERPACRLAAPCRAARAARSPARPCCPAGSASGPLLSHSFRRPRPRCPRRLCTPEEWCNQCACHRRRQAFERKRTGGAAISPRRRRRGPRRLHRAWLRAAPGPRPR